MSSDRSKSRTLREAYETLNSELVEVHDNLTVPSASPAWLEYGTNLRNTDAEEIQRRFQGEHLSFIDIYGDEWCEFYVWAKVFHDGANESANIKVSTPGVAVCSKRDLSYETFVDIVHVLENVLKTGLEFAGDRDD